MRRRRACVKSRGMIVLIKVHSTAVKQGGTADITYSSLAESNSVKVFLFSFGRAKC